MQRFLDMACGIIGDDDPPGVPDCPRCLRPLIPCDIVADHDIGRQVLLVAQGADDVRHLEVHAERRVGSTPRCRSRAADRQPRSIDPVSLDGGESQLPRMSQRMQQ
ncbi:hypothetical protein QP179_07175 [Sphingomonas aurantiaca]|uniref:hypothetical protein n=1 Tax=Sphingomonas aurantiaca TaxID=185949 RepID=UPI00304B179E